MTITINQTNMAKQYSKHSTGKMLVTWPESQIIEVADLRAQLVALREKEDEYELSKSSYSDSMDQAKVDLQPKIAELEAEIAKAEELGL